MDYAQPGAYFITIVTQGRAPLLGEIDGTDFVPSPAGAMIEHWWQELANKCSTIALAEFVTMPKHIHGIVWLNETPGGSVSVTAMLDWFKTMTTSAYIRGVKSDGWPAFNKKLWQRSYYDHIIRKDKDLNRIREYIRDNPLRWAEDHENPAYERSRDTRAATWGLPYEHLCKRGRPHRAAPTTIPSRCRILSPT